MALSARQTTLVASTPTLLVPQGSGTGFTFKNTTGSVTDPLPLQVKNEDATTLIYIGGPDVSATNGQSLAAGQIFTLSVISNDLPYAFCATAVVVSILVGRQ